MIQEQIRRRYPNFQKHVRRRLSLSFQRKEVWFETVERVVNGTFNMQKEHYESSGLEWDSATEERARTEAEEMYERIFQMKFLPPGRGLWAMGSKITTERKTYAALNNCAFVSTEQMASAPAAPFCFLMDASMLGVGVGFDTKGAGTLTVLEPAGEELFIIPDSREGWCESVEKLLLAYLDQTTRRPLPRFDYSSVRPAGSAISGFGGVSQGPEPLKELHEGIIETLQPLVGQPLSITAIVDIQNRIGKCVIAGNVRRTAEIAFGDPDSEEYRSLKDYTVNPQRASFGWTSNNTVLCPLGMDYSEVAKKVQLAGEPGFAWLENMRSFGRMNGERNDKDSKAMGGNPCLEQTLESYEMCCLVETFPHRHDSLDDFLATLRCAFLYAKTVTLGEVHWPETQKIMARNRRIGCSMSGLAQFVAARGIKSLEEWSERGYDAIQHIDEEISQRFRIPRSIKTTSIKPSGTVSLLAGATPGMHYPESRFYIRRVRLGTDKELLEPLRAAGFKIESCVLDAATQIVEIPVDAGEGVTAKDLTMYKQLEFAAFLQKHWADNQVSCTVTFDPETEGPELHKALEEYQYKLKGVSFLPRIPSGAYAQMPYEAITEEEYIERVKDLRPLVFSKEAKRRSVYGGEERAAAKHYDIMDNMPDNFCDSQSCEILGR